ncbi:hypothetical protein [Streptomyces sp. NPDC053048]|uniref:hypothetical protein n=1 Tax=Streptomyces sp. NPDC053048 TaxID=3365694 RepID=UPI0037D0E3EF
MPAYEDVSEEPQLSGRRTQSPKPEKVSETAITTTIPMPLRRQLSVALAVHQVKLKDAVTQALEEWLKKNPPTL